MLPSRWRMRSQLFWRTAAYVIISDMKVIKTAIPGVLIIEPNRFW